MGMQVVLPVEALPAKLTLNPELRMTDDEYFDFCQVNSDLWIERTAEGEIIITPPTGYESGYRNTRIVGQLDSWAIQDGRGKASGPSAEFILPTGAALSPDATWLSNQKLSQLSKKQRTKFPPAAPEFVIEVMSPSDRLPAAKRKMLEWIRGGVQLAWLIDGDAETVYIYRPGNQKPEHKTGITKLAGEGPVAGFELDLTDVWAGL
jgi:Uma2 family endonuclease